MRDLKYLFNDRMHIRIQSGGDWYIEEYREVDEKYVGWLDANYG